jgi:hypothetical protein
VSADRTERIKTLVRVALNIIRANATRHRLDLAEGPVHAWDIERGELSLSYRRPIDADHLPSKLIVKFRGERVLFAKWTIYGWTKRSYSAGVWEHALRRFGTRLGG